jgi:hypothetical protein
MLYDHKNQPVKISDKFNSKSHPHIFLNVKEVKDVLPHEKDPMFRLDQRCKLK